MLTLKVLACLALSALMLVPVILRGPLQGQIVQNIPIPNVDAHAMWSRWPQR
ncbi:hypothetical protein ACL9RI_24185 [Janthinobacterium sp. Mn2066]|uniref:hypothetical protein n=1 Tax=Janthinobacterium sp. Mn2066 TaxID=3395264 RepID=UPI003BC28483